MNELLSTLKGGDRRSTGRSGEVAEKVQANPDLFNLLVEGLDDPDPLIRMRAADAAEKVTAQQPHLLQAHKDALLELAARAEQQELRWHLAQMLPRLALEDEERKAAFNILLGYLGDKSRIVKTFAMQALADLAEQEPSLRPQAIERIRELTQTGSPAMQSRGRRLLAKLEG